MSIVNGYCSFEVLFYTINDILSDIFKRQYFFVYPDENVYQASLCLIPSIEVFIDGVIVIKNRKPIGVIGAKDVVIGYSKIGSDIFYKDASTIMYEVDAYLDEDTPLRKVIEYLKNKRIGFAPIVRDDGQLTAVISFRDILRLIAKSDLDTKVEEVYSKLITIDPDLTIGDALALMLARNIRRVVIKDEAYAISDRDILGFLMENEFGEKTFEEPLDAPITLASKMRLIKISPNTSISKAALIIMKQRAPPALLVSEDYIVTPWDLVNRGLRLYI